MIPSASLQYSSYLDYLPFCHSTFILNPDVRGRLLQNPGKQIIDVTRHSLKPSLPAVSIHLPG